MRRFEYLLPNERGAVAVEFALILPILLMLVMGIVYFGRGYNATVELTGAVREGARALALGDSETEAQDAVVAASPGLDPVTFGETTGCTGGADRARITARYSLDYNIPFVAQGEWVISRQGVMRCGG